jgi:hypothetical protein
MVVPTPRPLLKFGKTDIGKTDIRSQVAVRTLCGYKVNVAHMHTHIMSGPALGR